MADEKAAKSTPPSDATLKDFVAALGNIAAAVEKNTAQLQAVQQAGGFDRHRDHRRPGERFASVEQRRTILDYRVLDALVGRTTGENLVVNASRSRDQVSGADQVKILAVPDNARKVSVQAVGADRPELLSLDQSGGADKTVTLDATREKDIVRLELLNHAGEPIRLGPRLPRLPDAGQIK
jgi:hypothetical protein